MDKTGVFLRFLAGARNFSLLQSFKIGFVAHLVAYSVGTGGCFLASKEAGTNHSPPSREEVKNEWSYTSAVPYVLMELRGYSCNLTLFRQYIPSKS